MSLPALPYDIQYTCAGTAYCDSATWSSPIASGVSAWNTTPTTVYLSVYSYNYWNDVHVKIVHWPSDPYLFGASTVFDESYVACPGFDCPASGSRPNTWWWEHVELNNGAVWWSTYVFATNNAGLHRKQLTVHELGHGISLRHYSPTMRCDISIMDYDWLWPELATTPTAGDICGVNNAYYDPGWGYAGC